MRNRSAKPVMYLCLFGLLRTTRVLVCLRATIRLMKQIQEKIKIPRFIEEGMPDQTLEEKLQAAENFRGFFDALNAVAKGIALKRLTESRSIRDKSGQSDRLDN